MTHLPRTYSELLAAGFSKRTLRSNFVRICSGIYVPSEALGADGPRGLPILARAIAVQKRAPTSVISGWAALEVLGLPHIDDHLPVHFWTNSCHSKRDLKLNAIPMRGRQPIPAVEVFIGGFSVRVVSPAVAAIDCLISLRSGAASWWVPAVPGLTHKETRMIQVIDMVRTRCGTTLAALRSAAKGRFDADELDKLLQLSDAGAESLQESLLRLIVRDLAEWESQVPFTRENGRKFTAADLASKLHRVALFYDGGHHLDRSQRDHDSDVVQLLHLMGWQAIRITNGQLRRPDELRRRVRLLLSS